MDSVKLLQAFNPTDQFNRPENRRKKTNWLHSIMSAIKPTTHVPSEQPLTHWIRYHRIRSLDQISSDVVESLQCSTGHQWHSQTWLESSDDVCVCFTTLFLNHCRLVLSFLPLLSFLWGNNEQHTRGSKIALRFTHAQSHTHTLSFITLTWKKRGERRV